MRSKISFAAISLSLLTILALATSWNTANSSQASEIGHTNTTHLIADIADTAPEFVLTHSPEKIQGPKKCSECHDPEIEAWKKTKHHASFKISRSDEAKAILERLGRKNMKKAATGCVDCHYTVGLDRAKKPKAIAGISCESCHGAAKEWYDKHQDVKGESPADRQSRLDVCERLGMIRPTNIYGLASNCNSCHTVPNEQLVITGLHRAGSDGFELVAWSQGEVRHNLTDVKAKTNREASPERKRMLYVMGQIVALEYGLRGYQKATTESDYATKTKARIEKAIAMLNKIQEKKQTPEVAAILAAVQTLKLTIPPAKGFEKIADVVRKKAHDFEENHDGSKLGAIDELIPKQFKGTIHQPGGR
ncbi:MAG: cytochrome c family protein [Candidatus Marinimicrobia bacterium]|nr:cytochrome c family protein [Candidatus Neomarinimicrobiota bacterium]